MGCRVGCRDCSGHGGQKIHTRGGTCVVRQHPQDSETRPQHETLAERMGREQGLPRVHGQNYLIGTSTSRWCRF